MKLRLFAPAVLAAVLIPGAALAQGMSNQQNQNANQSANQNAQNLPQEIRQKLTSQGFTNVEVVPGSFIVSAKDKQGDPVTMVIGPHSMTIFTVETSGNSATVGSGSNQNRQPGNAPGNR